MLRATIALLGALALPATAHAAPPMCLNGSATTPVDHSVLIHLPCADPDGDELNVELDSGRNGTLELSNDSGEEVLFTPNAGFAGTETFQYIAFDDAGNASAQATMTVRVGEAPADAKAPAVSLKSAPQTPKQAAAKGVSITLTSGESGTATLTLSVDATTARKLGLDPTAIRPVIVGRAISPLVKGSRAVAVKVADNARKAISAASTVKLLVAAVAYDAAQNKTTKTLSVTLKR
jgi:Bacterial Ig domain